MYDNNPDTDTSNQFQMSQEALTDLGENVDAEKASRQQIQEFTGQAQPEAAQQPAAQAEPVKEEEPQPTEEKEELAPKQVEEKESMYANYGDRKPLGPLQGLVDFLAAPGQGLNDYVIDELNKIPGLNLKKGPKYQNDVNQAVREISSIVTPTVVIGRKALQAGKAANLRVGHKLGQSQLIKTLGETGVAAGTGVYVDATNRLNEFDDNLSGWLKNTWPKTWSWIPDDIATMNGDSTDTKRLKNINEGVYLGVGTDLFQSTARLVRALRGMKEATGFIPKDDTATAFFAKVKKKKALSDDPAVDTMLTAAEKREEALDELGDYLADTNPVLDEPMPGIHTMFDASEEGVRSVDDGGVLAAAADQAAINKNLGSRGRLANIISEGALKFMTNGGIPSRRQVIEMLADTIKGAGKYDYEYQLGKVSFAEIDKAGDDLVEILIDPRMDKGMIKGVLDEFKNSVNTLKGEVRPLSDVGYNAAFKAIKRYMDEYINMDTLKAQAYLTTSLGGQMADLAEGARYMEGADDAVSRAQEQILDRMEYLLVEKGITSYHRGAGLSNINLFNRFRMARNPGAMQEIAENARAKTEDALSDLMQRAKATTNTFREIAKERPNYLMPLQMAWEFTDGKIDTLYKLNRYAQQSLGDVHKGFIDGNPEIDNVIVQGYWANIYNSVLSAISTPLKAAYGNASMMMLKPTTAFAGAMLRGDGKMIRRAWFQYTAITDSFSKGAEHMMQVFHKASTDPTSVGYIMRDDIARKNEAKMDTLFSYAIAAERDGNSGPMVLWEHAKMLNDLAENPILRFGANAMTALDGFTRAVMANVESRGRIFDQFVDGDMPLNGQTLKDANEKLYREMFDSTGMITDKAVDHASREIALNLDNAGVDALGALINHVPAIKPFLMFPRTSANVLAMADKFAPISVFQREYNKLAYKRLDDFTGEEIIEVLTAAGKPIDDNLENTFRMYRAEVLGRKAIGTMAVTMGVGLFLNDRIHGNGHYDQQRQKTRQDLDWKPRSIKGLDGKWYSYDGIPGISDWLALTADVMDNFDVITEQDEGDMLNKLGFLLSANLTNKSMLAGVEPMFDVLRGNPAAISRWAASFTSAQVPFSGFRNELGRLMSPQLREVNQEFFELLRNRNKFLDALDPSSALPNKYDWIDGKLVGYSENFFTRAWNAISPIKQYDDISPERQYLVDIEYDSRPIFNKNRFGVEYSPEEKSELYSRIGQDGNFRRDLQAIMQRYPADMFRSSIKQAKTDRASNPNLPDIDPNLWKGLYREINQALRRAKQTAEINLSTYKEVRNRSAIKRNDEYYQTRGEVYAPILENR